MHPSHSTSTDCVVVAEFTDDAGGDSSASLGIPVVTQLVPETVDTHQGSGELSTFTVLLTDGRVVRILGHRLGQSAGAESDADSVTILRRTDDQEIVVGLFSRQHIQGVFLGEISTERKIA